MPSPHRKRRIFAALLALTLVAGLLFPIWSAWLARPLASQFAQLEIGSVQRLSWDRWQLADLQLQQDGVAFEAKTLEAPSPAQLILQFIGLADGDQTIALDTWTLNLTEAEKPPSEAPTPTAREIWDTVASAMHLVEAHSSKISLTHGAITQNEQALLELEALTLEDRKLDLKALLVTAALPETEPVNLSIDLSDDKEWTIAAAAPRIETNLNAKLRRDPAVIDLSTTLSNQGNTLEIDAEFPSDAPLGPPDVASLSASNLVLDSRYPFLAESETALHLDLAANWKDKRLSYQLTNSPSQPVDARTPRLNIAGSGSAKTISIDAALIEFPWLSLVNDRPIRFDLSKENPLTDAALKARIDLSKIPNSQATGEITAQLKTLTTEAGLPQVTGTTNGNNIQFLDTKIDTLAANFRVTSEQGTLSELKLVTAAGSKLELDGTYRFESQTIESAAFNLQLQNESAQLRSLIGPVTWQSLSLAATASGPATNPDFEATLALPQVSTAALRPTSLNAALTGNFTEILANATLENAAQRIVLDATLNELLAAQTTVTLKTLDWTTDPETPFLSLQNPASLRIQKSDSSIDIDPLVLSHESGRSLSLQSFALTPDRLAAQLDLSQIDTEVVSLWLAQPLPAVSVASLELELDLGPERSAATATGRARWLLSETTPIHLDWQLAVDPARAGTLAIQQLEVTSEGREIIGATGQAPLTLAWQDSQLLADLAWDAPFALSARSSPHPDFWAELANYIPVRIRQPRLSAEIEGTLAAPRGSVDLAVAALDYQSPDTPSQSLSIEGLSLTLDADKDQISLRSLEASVGKNQLQATATFSPKPNALLASFQKDPRSILSAATAKIYIVDLAPLSPWLPPVMRKSGQAEIFVSFADGAFSGLAKLKNFATRPMPPLGALSNIEGNIRFDDQILTAEKLQGLAEKSPFQLAGTVDLSDLAAPLYDLAFDSKAFPLVRDNGVLLSGDIDLALKSSPQQAPTLSGKLQLTKGLILIEPNLLASSTKTVSSRPPYFAVEAEPFSRWNLDMLINSDKTLRVSNSFFEGSLSADFSLEGTLGTPLLIGKAETNTGIINFPASSLKLSSGQAFITRDRPSEIQIEANATGRLFAHDVSLLASGTIDDPDLTITTNPALTQVDALLLLTTGALPSTTGDIAQKSATSLGVFIGKGLFRKLSGPSNDSASRLSLEIGQDISLQGKKTIEATYQLSEDLELEGAYDKRDEFNANLKWTFFKK